MQPSFSVITQVVYIPSLTIMWNVFILIFACGSFLIWLVFRRRTRGCNWVENDLFMMSTEIGSIGCRLPLKCDGTRAEIRFRLSAKRTSPFKSAGKSIQSINGSRGVRINVSNAGYTMFRGSVKSTGYTFHSPVSPSLPLTSVTVCHHISTGLYHSILSEDI
jgi:hypothetical protein